MIIEENTTNMVWSCHILHALQVPRVTHAQVSGDQKTKTNFSKFFFFSAQKKTFYRKKLSNYDRYFISNLTMSFSKRRSPGRTFRPSDPVGKLQKSHRIPWESIGNALDPIGSCRTSFSWMFIEFWIKIWLIGWIIFQIFLGIVIKGFQCLLQFFNLKPRKLRVIRKRNCFSIP